MNLIAYIFSGAFLLDASKTGRRLRPGIFVKDDKQFGKPRPKCLDPNTDQPNLESGGTFILEILLNDGKRIKEELLKEYDSVSGKNGKDTIDPDLLAPYKNAKTLSQDPDLALFASELEIIVAHVDECRKKYNKCWSQKGKDKEAAFYISPFKKSSKKRKPSADQDMLPVAEEFHMKLQGIRAFKMQEDEIKASYAYSLNPRFAFSMAFQDLCDIKRKSRPPSARHVDEARTVPSAALRILKRLGEV